MSTLTRLRHGQAVPIDAELAAWLPAAGLTAGEGLPEAARVALRTDGYLIVARRETRGEAGEQLRPERVLAGEKVAPPA